MTADALKAIVVHQLEQEEYDNPNERIKRAIDIALALLSVPMQPKP